MLENEVKEECKSRIEQLQQSGKLRAINYNQSTGVAFGYSQVKKAMFSLPGGKQAFKKLKATTYGIPGMPDDIVVFEGGRIIYHEMKRSDGGIISPDQRKFEKICKNLKIPHSFIKSEKEMLDAWYRNKLF